MSRTYATTLAAALLTGLLTVVALRVASDIGVTAPSTLSTWALPIFFYGALIALGFQVMREAAELLGHEALTRRQLEKVGARIAQIRSMAVGLIVFFAIAGLVAVGTPQAAELGIASTMGGLAYLGSSAVVSLCLAGWLIGRSQEVHRFKQRLEVERKRESTRVSQLEALREGAQPRDTTAERRSSFLAI